MVFEFAYSTETRRGYEEGGTPLRTARHRLVASRRKRIQLVLACVSRAWRASEDAASSASCAIEREEAIKTIGTSEIPAAREPMRDPRGITEWGGRHFDWLRRARLG